MIITEDKGVTKLFCEELEQLLSEKISNEYKDFNVEEYIKTIEKGRKDLVYTKKIELHEDVLREYLPGSYPEALIISIGIL